MIGAVPQFQEIQLDFAMKFHSIVITAIEFLKSLRLDLMQRVQVLTYVALYDLTVQQGKLNSAKSQISARVARESPAIQKELLEITVQERPQTATPQWRFNSMSRRMGIIWQKPYPHEPLPHERPRSVTNENYKLLDGISDKEIMDL